MNQDREYQDPFYNKHSNIRRWGSQISHWNQNYKFQFLTMHLTDALPWHVVLDYETEHTLWLSQHPQPWSTEDALYHKIKFEDFLSKYLDKGYGACYLRNIECAKALETCLWYDHGRDYWLTNYVIMPNHVHILVQMGETPLEVVLGEWKKYSANKINKIVGRRGALWQRRGYWDTIVRNQEHFENVNNYIWRNWLNGGIIKMTVEE